MYPVDYVSQVLFPFLSLPAAPRWCQQAQCPARRAATQAQVKVVASQVQRVKRTGPRSSLCSGPTAWRKPCGRSLSRLRKVRLSRWEKKPFYYVVVVGPWIKMTDVICPLQWWMSRTDTHRSRGCHPHPPSKGKTARSRRMLSHVSVPVSQQGWGDLLSGHFGKLGKKNIHSIL